MREPAPKSHPQANTFSNSRNLPSLTLKFFGGLLHWLLIPVLATTLIEWTTISSGLRVLLTDPGDTLLNLYFLEHAFQHFTNGDLGNPEAYWSPQFFWPIKDTLAWSDHLLGPSLIYGLFRLTFDPFQAYVCWLSSTLVLNYISIRYAIRRIAQQTSVMWLSLIALLTAFSPTITQQLNHPQLLSLFLIGPILVACHKLMSANPSAVTFSDWTAVACLLLANGFFNIYIFVYAAYGVLICSCIHLIRRLVNRSIDFKPGQPLIPLLSLLAVMIILNLIIYTPYLQTLRTFGKRPLEEIMINLPKPASWLFGSTNWLLPPPLSNGHFNHLWVQGAEQELFPGWGIVILLGATITTTIFYNRRSEPRLWLAALFTMVLLSISIQGISLWPLVSKFLPGANSLRASSRVAMMIVLFASPSMALASNQWRFPADSKKIHSVGWLLFFVAGFSTILPVRQPAFSLRQWRLEKDAMAAKLKESNCDIFWHEWREQEPWRAHVQAMHIQLSTGIPTANGYSGNFPKENWPFSRPSGIGALSWIKHGKAGRFHRLREIDKDDIFCIIKYNNNKSIDLQKLKIADRVSGEKSKDSIPKRLLLEQKNIVIAADQNQWLIFQDLNKPGANWIPLLRDGQPMPAYRGSYIITSISHVGDKILIRDTNRAEGIEYQWQVNASNGRFMSQTMRRLK